VAAAQQLVAQMRPQEPRATGDEAGGHGGHSTGAGRTDDGLG
jgi:hypothetical protein